jgi:hypothetical protein
MAPVLGKFARLVVLLAVIITPFTPPPATGAALPKGETPLSGMYPEVRLRKLHLVRPDLIPYPIAYEVCC